MARTAAVLAGLLLFAFEVRAATIEVFGADGAAGTNAPPAATPGGSGAPATATSDGPDATNEAIAHGGRGGTGGAGAPVGGAAGGTGGAASAHAQSSTTDSDALASSHAIGGSGGSGGFGAGIETQAVGGPGGDGAAADATSHASSLSGAATATALAQGGNGAAGGSAQFDTPRVAIVQGGAPASASATAEATSETGAATATAQGFAGQALALGNPPAPGQVSSATALATTNGTADAVATAEARGNIQVVNGAHADAEAHSAQGNATAQAIQIAGPSEPSVGRSGPFPTYGGGPGVGSAMLDQVRGSAGGLLSLTQQATASSAHEGYAGGDASSILHAQNPGGGALSAEVTAVAGNGTATCQNLPGPSCFAGPGGAAEAIVGASSTTAPVVARALANAGVGGENYHGGIVTPSNAGNGFASASAASPSNALASARSSTGVGGNVHALAEAAGVTSTFSEIEMNVSSSSQIVRSASTGAGVGAAFEAASGDPGGHGELFALPNAADVSAFLAGNPNATAAAAGGRVVALGSLGANGQGDSLSGSLLMDGLAGVDIAPGDQLSIAFLDPTSALGGTMLFDLTITNGSPDLFFSRVYSDTGTPVGELDDAVFALGASTGQLAFGWHATLESAGDFDLDFAVIATSAVPEPAPIALLALAALAYRAAISSRRASSTRR